MKKVFVLKNDGFYVSVEEAELAVVETEEGEDGYTRYTVLFDDGEIEDYFDGDVYFTYEGAEAAAARVNEERDQLMDEARSEAAQVYYEDVLAQCLA